MRYIAVALALLIAGCTRPAPPPPAPSAAPQPEPPAVTAPEPPSVTRAGIWIGADEAESGSLIESLAPRGITDVFIRTRPLQPDGTLVLPSPEWVTEMRTSAHDRSVRLWAWVPGVRTRLDLGSPKVAATVAKTAASLAALGYDGIQFDIEPVTDEDSAYLTLLDLTREQLPTGKLLGAATHLVRPEPAAAEWSPAYLAKVANRLDQVAVMAYDTYAKSPEEFRGYVAYQTRIALEQSPESTEVLIGVPAYEDRTERHTPETEPLAAGLAGVADGWALADRSGRVTGWAIFAHYTMDESEWETWSGR